MGISYLTGQMLNNTLVRDGIPLAFSNVANSVPLLFLDIANSRIGINTSVPNVTHPNTALVVNGNLYADNLSTTGNINSGNIFVPGIISATGNIYTQDYFIGNFIGNISGNISVPGVNNDILYNNQGNVGASNNLTFDYANNILRIGGIISASGNITGNYIIGNGSALTSLTGANVTGTVANATYAVSANNSSFAGTVTTNAQPNITSVGTLISVNTSGNVSASGNVYTGNVYTGNVNLGNSAIWTLDANNHGFTANIQNPQLVGLGLTDGGSAVLYGNTEVQITANSSGNAQSWNFNANGNFQAPGNATVLGILTDNYYYANGVPVNFSGTYGNSNVANYLPTFYGNIGVGNITSNINTNINIVPNGNGIVTIANINGGATGIQLGTPTAGNLVSNALTLYTNTSVTNGIAELNQILGKLIPPAPPNFPAGQTISINGVSSYRMANGVNQFNNTTTGNKSVAAGTTVSTVLRTNSYGTTPITVAGPGDSGTLSVCVDSIFSGNVTFNPNATPTGNGTHNNLIVYNNYDYHYANATITPGFWYVFSTSAAGIVLPGWNEVYFSDSSAGNSNTTIWYYDNSNPGTPQFTSTSITSPGSPVYTYSSTIPHYINTNIFTITGNVNRLSGNMYPISDTFATGSNGGAFGAPVSLTYSSSNIATPLPQNLYANTGNIQISTTSTIISGFGASNVGPTLSVFNSYATGTNTFNPGANVLYKTGTSTAIDESNIVIGSTIGSGSGNAFRIVNPGTGNTPVYTGSEAAFNSQTGPIYTYDAVVVGSGSQGVLTFSQTNFSTGYLPVGPNFSGSGSNQWFTFKFVRAATSKFDIQITGTVGGVWVALPGSVFDSNIGGIGPTSDLNGWLNMNLPYGGAGRPGANSSNGGNGSDGCSLGGIIPLNTAINGRYTCTFGTVSSSSSGTNEIYVRIRLTSGQSVTALSLQTASN